MGAALCDSSAAARTVFAAADQVTGLPVTEICRTGSLEQLTQTEFTQISVVATSLAAAAALAEHLGHVPEAVAAAGHSVGELAAMCWAGSLSLEETFLLVAERGRLMARDSAQVDGIMAAVIGLDATALVGVCRRAFEQTGQQVQVANHNAPDQVVISGARVAVEAAGKIAQADGASRVILLNVGGPFHSIFMTEAAREFAGICATATFNEPRCPIILNTTALPETDPVALRNELATQITSPVRWSESLQALVQLGCTHVVEIGPGRVLSGLVRRTAPQLSATSAGTPEALGQAAALWEDPEPAA